MGIRQLWSRRADSAIDIYECRACGTTLDPEADACTECGADDIAYYSIEA